MHTNSVCITNGHSENITVGILTFLDWVRLHGLCRQNKLEWRSAAAPSFRCFAQAYKTGHRWRFFRSFKIHLWELNLFFRVNSDTMKLEQIFSLTNTLQSLNFHLPKWDAHKFVWISLTSSDCYLFLFRCRQIQTCEQYLKASMASTLKFTSNS